MAGTIILVDTHNGEADMARGTSQISEVVVG
jgi:hypothetical protein